MITGNKKKAQIVTLWVGVNVCFQSPSTTDFWRKEISLKENKEDIEDYFFGHPEATLFFFFNPGAEVR